MAALSLCSTNLPPLPLSSAVLRVKLCPEGLISRQLLNGHPFACSNALLRWPRLANYRSVNRVKRTRCVHSALAGDSSFVYNPRLPLRHHKPRQLTSYWGRAKRKHACHEPAGPLHPCFASSTAAPQSAEDQPDGKKVFWLLLPLVALWQHTLKVWGAIRSILPYGSWWELGQAEEEVPSQTIRQVLRRVTDLVGEDALVLYFAFVFLIVAALSELAIPHYVAASIFAASKGLASNFYYNARLLTAMTLSYGLASGLRGGFFSIANQQLVLRMREKLYNTIIKQEVSFFDKESVGDLTSRLGSDCQSVARVLGVNANIMLRNSLQAIGGLVYLIKLSHELAAWTMVVCVLMWGVMLFAGRYQRVAAKVVQDTLAGANDVAEETFSLSRMVRTFGTEQQEATRYLRWAQRIVELSMRQSAAYGLSTWASNTLYYAMTVVALVLGGTYVMQGRITGEQLTTFVLYVEMVISSSWMVGDQWSSLMEAIGASDKVFQLMDLPPAEQLVHPGRVLPQMQGRLEFRGVSFRYPTRPLVPVLDNVDLVVQPGELVALVGLSGSGKSTLVGLLQRHYDPSEGQILVDDVPLQDLDAAWFRTQLGVVSQDPHLFSMTIADNIAYGAGPGVSASEIERAASIAHAHNFISLLPLGYSTPVRDGRLSGGQRQRIAIARALVRDPQIMILDEATSALDAESEQLVQKAMDQVMKGLHGGRKRTVLVIAHRLSTIRNADRIVVMKAGQIVEVGTHEELIAHGGEYANLTQRQRTTIP